MKNCIYDIICIQDFNYYRYRSQIEKEFCKTVNCKCINCIYDVVSSEDSNFGLQIEKEFCKAPECRCTNCILFVEVDDLKDFKDVFKRIIISNKRSIKGNSL